MHKHAVRRAVVTTAGESFVRARVSCAWAGRDFTLSSKRCPACGERIKVPKV